MRLRIPNYSHLRAQGFVAGHPVRYMTAVYTSPCTGVYQVYPGCVYGGIPG